MKIKPIKELRKSIRAIQKKITKLTALEIRTPEQEKVLRKHRHNLELRMTELEWREQSKNYRPKKWPVKTDFAAGDYHKYITSPEWASRKEAYYLTHKRQCRTCGADERDIHLHHRTYKRIYREDDSDLMPLCCECHAALHYLQGRYAMSVEQATALWMAETNNVSNRKDVREALRGIDFQYFAYVCEVRVGNFKTPQELLAAVIRKIARGGKAPPKDYIIMDPAPIKMAIATGNRTGNYKSYDEQVDEIIRRLEGGDRFKL